MQNLFVLRKNQRLGVAVVLIGLTSSVGLIYRTYGSEKEVTAVVADGVVISPRVADTISYGVTGVVEASQSLTLYAKRAGFVKRVGVTEGELVAVGTPLVVAVDPTTEARLGVQEAAGVLSALSAKNGVIGAEQQKQLAEISYSESVAVSAITSAGAVERVQAARAQLAATLSEVEVVVPQALRFVQDNQSLFTAESMTIYDEVVKIFYGREPNYLRTGVLTSGQGEDLFSQIHVAKSTTTNELVVVSKRVTTEFVKLLDLYTASESEFFDEKELASDSEELATYLELRSAVAAITANLAMATDGVLALTDASHTTSIQNTHGTTSALLGSDTARAQAEIVSLIEGKTNELSSAEMNVIATELGLGFTEAPFSGTVLEVMVEEGQYVQVGEPLVRLSGSDAKELLVKLTGVGKSVVPGAAFIVEGKTVGVVDRVVPVLEAGSMTAYIAITDPSVVVGEVVRGEIAVTVGAGYHVIPRLYMRFDSTGPYVVTLAGEKIYFKIIHDTGAFVVIEAKREINEDLIPAVGVRL